jgi:mycothiol synthase
VTLTQLEMRRPHLEGLPALRAPDGYELRTWRPGDEARWAAVMDGAIGAWDEERVRSEFLHQDGVEPDNIFVVAHGGELVATATARRLPDPATGYVHMVAADPAHRGRGLGTLVNAAVLHRLRELGCTSARLHTDDDRLPAIRIYRRLGFEPRHTAPDHAERWARVLDAL